MINRNKLSEFMHKSIGGYECMYGYKRCNANTLACVHHCSAAGGRSWWEAEEESNPKAPM